jgi:hypothetical protein
MTFAEITRIMLNSMDFFQLRRTAKRYEIPFQGTRRQKLIRDLERKIVARTVKAPAQQLVATKLPQGATSAKPILEAPRKGMGKRSPGIGINTFSARNSTF